jgi:hypothetical protein
MKNAKEPASLPDLLRGLHIEGWHDGKVEGLVIAASDTLALIQATEDGELTRQLRLVPLIQLKHCACCTEAKYRRRHQSDDPDHDED